MLYPIKRYIKFYAALCCILCSYSLYGQQPISLNDSFEKLLNELDLRLSQTDQYKERHLKEIQDTRILQTSAPTPQEKILQTRVLVEHFLFYQSDSCLHYADQAIQLAKEQNDKSTENQMICRKAIAYALSGLPWAGEALLDSLLQTPLDRSSKNEVFKAEIDILEQFQHQDLPNDLVTRNYMRMETLEDSVSKYDPEPHSRLLRLKYRNNSEQEIIDRLKATLAQSDNNTEKAAYAMIIAGKCQQQNKLKERNRFWAMAAIYDVEAHKMISSALVRLSALMMEQGDWKRATRYAQEASKRAVFYRARSQNYEVSPILEKCLAHEKAVLKRNLAIFGSLIVVLAVLASIFWMEMKKNKTQKQNLQKELEQEKQMYQTAEIKGNQLEESMKSLSEGLMHFLSISIDSIYELGAMRHTVMNKIRSKEIEQLAALFKGDTNLARNQKNLLRRFDIAFTRLYPDFQKQVNALLKEDCKIETPDNELLNNELRLLALLKLGISDSSRIATILDISVNTVYFYRNRLKNKAVDRDAFEEQVLQISL